MAKKTKKNNVVKKTVKASKPNKNSKPAKSKTKSAKAAAPAKKNGKPAGKAVKPAQKKSARPAASAKGNNGKKVVKAVVKAVKTVVKKVTSKAVNKTKPAVKSKTVQKTAPSKAQKTVKQPISAKAVKAEKGNAAINKTAIAKPVPAAKKPEPVAKKAEAPKVNGKTAEPKAEVKQAASPQPAPARPARKARRSESRPAPEFNEDGTPVKMVKLNGRKHAHPEPTRVISAPVVAPKPVVVQADKKKEPKGKFELEYVVHASSELLFEFLTTPSGLSEWFADDVNIRQGVYTFFWDGAEQQAKLIGYKEPRLVRYQWTDKSDGSYFEFRIEVDELTRDVSLIITDFAEDPAEQHTSKLLWDSQVNKLLHVIGAYY